MRAGACALLAALWCACAPVPQAPGTCAGEGSCEAGGQCAAGRCLARGAPSGIAAARRLLFDPVDLAYIRRGGGGVPAVPSSAVLGGPGDGLVLLRFRAELPPGARVLDAFLLLQRAPGVSAGAAPVELHVAPVLEAWDGNGHGGPGTWGGSWARAPRVGGRASPVTVVAPGSGAWIRVDVRDVVRRWRERPGEGYGLALVARVPPVPGAQDPGSGAGPGLAVALAGGSAAPRLELYVE
jgi:hypothetical protein